MKNIKTYIEYFILYLIIYYFIIKPILWMIDKSREDSFVNRYFPLHLQMFSVRTSKVCVSLVSLLRGSCVSLVFPFASV